VDGEERTAERNHVGPLCWVTGMLYINFPERKKKKEKSGRKLTVNLARIMMARAERGKRRAYDCTWNAEWNGCMTSNGWWGQTDTSCQLDTIHGQTATGFEKRSSPGKCGGVVVEILNSIIFESPRKAVS
jgi:hypothetical protein